MTIETNFKQPHEGVVGTARGDGLLDLDEAGMRWRKALTACASQLHGLALSAGLRHRPAEQVWERMSKPMPGDLVFEPMVTAVRGTKDPRSFGVLIEHRREWASTDEEWAELVAQDPDRGERRTEFAYYVQYGPNAEDVCRWTNCEFVMIPTSRERAVFFEH